LEEAIVVERVGGERDWACAGGRGGGGGGGGRGGGGGFCGEGGCWSCGLRHGREDRCAVVGD